MREPPPPRAVLFDLDGVLVDSYELWFALMNQAADAFGCAAIDRQAFARMFGQGVTADARLFGCSVAEVEAFFDAHFRDHLGELRVEPDAAPVLARLRGAGIGTALITNTQTALAQEVLVSAGLELGVVVGGTDVAEPKPAPDMVRRACELLDVAPGRVWVVGDSSYDRDAARAAGVYFFGLKTEGDQRLESLKELCEWLT